LPPSACSLLFHPSPLLALPTPFPPPARRRFITNNLMVEITSTKMTAKLFAWALKRHLFISFFLYCAGKLIHICH
jgi:hypothetical protein